VQTGSRHRSLKCTVDSTDTGEYRHTVISFLFIRLSNSGYFLRVPLCIRVVGKNSLSAGIELHFTPAKKHKTISTIYVFFSKYDSHTQIPPPGDVNGRPFPRGKRIDVAQCSAHIMTVIRSYQKRSEPRRLRCELPVGPDTTSPQIKMSEHRPSTRRTS